MRRFYSVDLDDLGVGLPRRRVVSFVMWLPEDSAVARFEGWAWSLRDQLLDDVRRTLAAAHLQDGDPGPHPLSPAGRQLEAQRYRRERVRAERLSGLRARVAEREEAARLAAELQAQFEAQQEA